MYSQNCFFCEDDESTIPVSVANQDMKMKSDKGSHPYQDKNNSFEIMANHTADDWDSGSTKDYDYHLPDG